MDGNTRAIINELTQDIINVYNISIPIGDIDDLVRELGGEIKEEENFCDGGIQKNGDGFIIFLSPFQDEKRRRFTIAHELGHLFLHMGYRINPKLWEAQPEHSQYYRNVSDRSEREYQANEFAAALLMPKYEYLKIMKNNIEDGNLVNTQSIANYFNVSVEAASNRGKFLGVLQW